MGVVRPSSPSSLSGWETSTNGSTALLPLKDSQIGLQNRAGLGLLVGLHIPIVYTQKVKLEV